MNRWTALSFVIFLFTVLSSPVEYEAGEQLAGIEAAPATRATPTGTPDSGTVERDNQRMTTAFEAKLDALQARIESAQRTVQAQQAALLELDQRLAERPNRSSREPTQADVLAQERKLIQDAALSQLEREISRQRAVVVELGLRLQQELATNINYSGLEGRRARLQHEQKKLADLQAQYRNFQLQVGIDQQQWLERTLEQVMTENNDALALEERKQEAGAALERARNELATLEADRNRAQAELEELEERRRELELEQPSR